MPRTKPTTRPAPTGQAKKSVPLSVDLPGGGRARFYGIPELTPRRTRQLDTHLTAAMPLILRVRSASRLVENGVVDERAELPGPDMWVNPEQAGQMSDLNDIGIFTFLKDWTLDLDLPSCPDDLQDVPLQVYFVLRDKAAELVAEYQATMTGFTVEALGDDIDEADENLPTSA